MSIQSNINQGIAIAGALYTQTPRYASKKEAALEKRELAKINKGLESIDNKIITATEELNADMGERREALFTDIDNSRLSKKEKALAKKEYDKEMSLRETEYKKVTDEESLNRISLLKRKGDITGDYEPYITARYNKAADIANEKAEIIKQNKIKQSSKVYDKILNMDSNIGPIKDLNLSNKQLKSIKKQLDDKGNK